MKFPHKQAGLLLAVAGAAVVGGVSTALVSAAIPASDGVIHSCYKTGASPNAPSGGLRVIDSEANQTCTAQETALNWSATGGSSGTSNEAYTFIGIGYPDPANPIPTPYLDSSRTKNVTNMVYVPSQTDGDGFGRYGGYCITLPFTPKNVQATPQDENYNNNLYTTHVGVKDESGIWSFGANYTGTWFDPAVICQSAPTANAVLEFPGPQPYFLKFEN